MDQETAQALFDKGAFLVFLNAPEGMEVSYCYLLYNYIARK